MIDFGQRAEPYDIALPYGLSVTVKPLTTAGMAAAQAAARRGLEAIERQARERTEAGLVLDGLPDLSAEGERDGFYQVQLIRELAVRHITRWTGVELEGGPAPPTPENITAAMELYPVGERFFQEFTLRQVLLNSAKNGCGVSAAGTSSEAAGPNTAGPATTTACRAPEANPDPWAHGGVWHRGADRPCGAAEVDRDDRRRERRARSTTLVTSFALTKKRICMAQGLIVGRFGPPGEMHLVTRSWPPVGSAVLAKPWLPRLRTHHAHRR
jgi:hypothetical protein